MQLIRELNEITESLDGMIHISYLDPSGGGGYYSHIVGRKSVIKQTLIKALTERLTLKDLDAEMRGIAEKGLAALQKDDWKAFGLAGVLSQGDHDEIKEFNPQSQVFFIDGDHGQGSSNGLQELASRIEMNFNED